MVAGRVTKRGRTGGDGGGGGGGGVSVREEEVWSWVKRCARAWMGEKEWEREEVGAEA